MSLDFTAHSAVVVPMDTLFDALVNEQTRADVCRLLIDNTALDLNEGYNYFSSLRSDSSVEELRSMFLSMMPVGDGESGGYVENEEEGLTVWSHLIQEFAPEIPTIECAICITNPDLQGNYELPRVTVLFVFSEEECFTKQKTDAGRQLDTILGQETELSEWTTYC